LPDGAVLANYSRELLVEALRFIFVDERRGASRRVILPSFVCNTLVDAVLSAGGVPVFHGLDRNLTPRLDEVERELDIGAAAWLVVDYFGMQPDISSALIDKARHLGCRVIHDGAHSFLGLMADPTRSLAGFDCSVFSIYKALATGTGAVGFGLPSRRSRVSLPLMAVMAARKGAKHVVAMAAGGRLVNRGMEILHQEAPATLFRLPANAGGVPVLRLIAEHHNYAAIAADAAAVTPRLAAAAEAIGAPPVFDEAQRARNVLQGFPVRFATQAERDRMIALFRARRIDAHTWPTFSTLATDEAIWRTLLVLPVHIRTVEALEALQAASRRNCATSPY